MQDHLASAEGRLYSRTFRILGGKKSWSTSVLQIALYGIALAFFLGLRSPPSHCCLLTDRKNYYVKSKKGMVAETYAFADWCAYIMYSACIDIIAYARG